MLVYDWNLFSTNLDIADPLSNSPSFPFDVHHTRSASAAKQDEDIMEGRCLLELGHFLPRSDVVRPDQCVMEALHCFLGS